MKFSFILQVRTENGNALCLHARREGKVSIIVVFMIFAVIIIIIIIHNHRRRVCVGYVRTVPVSRIYSVEI
jgi:uncharacterized integral membrane protein